MTPAISRRALLKGGLTLGCSAAAFPMTTRVTFASAPGDNRFVAIVLRGALDGLAALGPWTDPAYLALRPRIATHPDRGGHDLDGRFALHAALAPLLPLWRAGELAFVHAVSTPYRGKRSHFDGQDVLENGTGAADGALTPVGDGWLNRALSLMPQARAETAVAVGREHLLLLSGNASTLAWAPDAELPLGPQALELWRGLMARDPLFDSAAREAVILDAALGEGAARSDAAGLAALSARMLREESRIAAFSLGGFDTHRNQGWALQRPLERLAEAIQALKTGLGPVWERTAVVAMTEFGRTARENGTGGTDHGTGGLTIWAGGALSGARVHGRWPGLGSSDLLEDRDLAPTDDLRRPIAWALRELFGVGRTGLERDVFPGLDIGRRPGLLA